MNRKYSKGDIILTMICIAILAFVSSYYFNVPWWLTGLAGFAAGMAS